MSELENIKMYFTNTVVKDCVSIIVVFLHTLKISKNDKNTTLNSLSHDHRNHNTMCVDLCNANYSCNIINENFKI